MAEHRRLKKKYKIIIIALIAVILLAALATAVIKILSVEPATEEVTYGEFSDVSVSSDESGYFAVEQENSTLTFMLIDVGQGQSIFIDYKDFEILIDAGSYDDGNLRVVNAISSYVDGSIDYIIATHSHEDHIGGFSPVFDNFTVDNVIYGELDTETTWGKIFAENASKAKTCAEDSNTSIVLGDGITLTIFDVADNMDDSNANSVVCLLKCGDDTFFMSGDLEEEQEMLLRNEKTIQDVDVVVAGHHGSDTSNSLMDILNPSYVLVSCGANNEYHHPHKAFLENASKYCNSIFATFKSGTITLTSDGNGIEFGEDIDRWKDRIDIENAGGVF